ncbi:MAG: hypothetical protein ABR531_06095 [Bacteroidales bacterium]
MEPDNFKVIGVVLIVLIIVYMIMKRRTDKIKSRRDNRDRFRRNR